jgi:hypothetical protein
MSDVFLGKNFELFILGLIIIYIVIVFSNLTVSDFTRLERAKSGNEKN